MKGREHEKQWLSGPDIPKRGDLRVVHFDEALDYVCGEAHRAYATIRPALWVRHILFVKEQKNGFPPYILICDETEAGNSRATFAWQLHYRLPSSLQGRDLNIRGNGPTQRPSISAFGRCDRRETDPRATRERPQPIHPVADSWTPTTLRVSGGPRAAGETRPPRFPNLPRDRSHERMGGPSEFLRCRQRRGHVPVRPGAIGHRRRRHYNRHGGPVAQARQLAADALRAGARDRPGEKKGGEGLN